MENYFNEVFPFFNPLNLEFFPGNRIIDTFSNHFSFYLFNKHSNYNIKSCIQQLDKLAFKSSNSLSSTLIVTDTSIKNNIATIILHIYIYNKSITKTLYYALNIMSSKAELFAIKYSINQAASNNNISKIIVVMNSIYVVRKIFNLEKYIKFWECSSHCNWYLYKVVDTETKSFKLILLLSSKLSWNFSNKTEYNDLIKK